MWNNVFFVILGILIGFVVTFVACCNANANMEKEKDEIIAELKKENRFYDERCEKLYDRNNELTRRADLAEHRIDDYSTMINVYKAANEKELGIVTYKGDRFVPDHIEFQEDRNDSNLHLCVEYISLPKKVTEG